MKEVVATANAPKAIGPYSQGIKAAGLIFFAGQIPIDPNTSEVVGSDTAAQTEQVMKNISAVLQAAGSSLAKVVKTTVFLKDLNDFTKMNQVYGRYIEESGSAPPARSTVEVAGLPRGALVEIEVIALQ